jgi:hypothetical protein
MLIIQKEYTSTPVHPLILSLKGILLLNSSGSYGLVWLCSQRSRMEETT